MLYLLNKMIDFYLCHIDVPKDDEAEKRVCSSAACFNQSMTILSVMNLSVDPCNDFYKHACGQWKYRYENSFEKLLSENRFIVQQILGKVG